MDDQKAQSQYKLKILYTISPNPQIILARHPKVPATVIPTPIANSTESDLGYARVRLQACVRAICGSSPELVALRDRDYSVYVMDPLEDCYALASSSKMPTTGVAVGMGLMSWILAEAEDAVDAVTATGRIRRDTISGETVEVVIALQATTTLTQEQHNHCIASWAMPISTPLPPSMPPNLPPYPPPAQMFATQAFNRLLPHMRGLPTPSATSSPIFRHPTHLTGPVHRTSAAPSQPPKKRPSRQASTAKAGGNTAQRRSTKTVAPTPGQKTLQIDTTTSLTHQQAVSLLLSTLSQIDSNSSTAAGLNPQVLAALQSVLSTTDTPVGTPTDEPPTRALLPGPGPTPPSAHSVHVVVAQESAVDKENAPPSRGIKRPFNEPDDKARLKRKSSGDGKAPLSAANAAASQPFVPRAQASSPPLANASSPTLPRNMQSSPATPGPCTAVAPSSSPLFSPDANESGSSSAMHAPATPRGSTSRPPAALVSSYAFFSPRGATGQGCTSPFRPSSPTPGARRWSGELPPSSPLPPTSPVCADDELPPADEPAPTIRDASSQNTVPDGLVADAANTNVTDGAEPPVMSSEEMLAFCSELAQSFGGIFDDCLSVPEVSDAEEMRIAREMEALLGGCVV